MYRRAIVKPTLKQATLKQAAISCVISMMATPLITSCGDRTAGRSTPKVVYGDDNRLDPRSYTDDSPLRAASKSVGIVIMSTLIQPHSKSQSMIATNRTYGESRTASGQPLCENERFQDQWDLMGTCSAFLVGPDLVASAGHCFPTEDSCQMTSVVFGVGSFDQNMDVRIVPKDHVYGCKKIIAQGKTHSATRSDFALIQLDRPVTGIEPLRINSTGPTELTAPLALIGYPAGLPLKIAERGHLLSESGVSWFRANLDSFGGSSGSPVINTSTGLVEGILSGGEEDYVQNGACWSTRVCRDDGQDCEGETVTRVSEITRFLEGRL